MFWALFRLDSFLLS
ncbi:hypothetical protein F383_33123 [Gossypium arboreum]|uniref:Uncharacterized protein n=1 Tax=Gossypium arboreum TaxID=29729 RepID=A0A0B0PQL2_GOSAR|nr:hypothetical protein F383_33123 [Gossypium arboreum]